MAESFAEYLARYRAKADVAASPALSNEEVRVLCLEQHVKIHESSIHYQYLGDDANGAPVYRLGTCIILQDISVQLAALVTARSLGVVPGAQTSYTMNPSIRK